MAITLPEGTIDLSDNVPPGDVGLLAPTANLVANEDLHLALLGIITYLQAQEIDLTQGTTFFYRWYHLSLEYIQDFLCLHFAFSIRCR